jgi:hypothetical protein
MAERIRRYLRIRQAAWIDVAAPWKRSEDRVPRGVLADAHLPRTISGTALDEARGCEITVECKGFSDPQRSHQGEAGSVDKRVGAFVVPAQPAQSFVFEIGVDANDFDAR